MLFHQNTTKALKIAMWGVGILVIVSMVLMYVPIPNKVSAPTNTGANTNIQNNLDIAADSSVTTFSTTPTTPPGTEAIVPVQ